MFDSPWPMNSWLPSMRCPDFSARARAIETASVKPRTVSASAAGASLRQLSGSNDGNEGSGSADGSGPTTGIAAPLTRMSR